MGAEQLQRGVERRLKRRVFVQPDEASLKVVVVFTRTGSETEARIELSSIDATPRGTRSLVTSGHCSALDDSLALSVALLVDQPPDPEPPPPSEPEPPAAEPATPPPPAAPPPSPAPRAANRPTPITIPPEVAAPREPWHAHLGVSALAAWGVVPAIAPGLALHVKLVPHGFFPIAIDGQGFAASKAERDPRSGAEFHLYRMGIAVCPALHERPEMALSLCAGQKVSWLTVQGYGFDHDREERRMGYALVAGGEGRLRLFAPVSARAYLGAEVPLSRDRFTSGGRGSTELFQPAPLALEAQIGLEAALW